MKKKAPLVLSTALLLLATSSYTFSQTYVYRAPAPGIKASLSSGGLPTLPDNGGLGEDNPDNTICYSVGQFQEIRLKEGLEDIGISGVLNDLSDFGVNISDPYFNLQETDFPISGAFLYEQGYISFMKVNERSSGVLDLNNSGLYIESNSAYESTVDESYYQMIVYNLKECFEDDDPSLDPRPVH